MTRTYDPGAVLVSLHLPKTAGTSFQSVLGGWFGDDLVLHYPPDVPAAPTTGAGLCVHGHFPMLAGFGLDRRYPGAQMITVLRDPFDLLLSYWRYANRRAEAGLRAPDLADSPSFEQWFDRRLNPGEGRPRPSFLRKLPATVDPASAEKGLSETFLAVGLTERMDDTLRLFAHVLGKPPVQAPRLNQTEPNAPEHEAWRDAHRRHWPEEHAVYAAAKALFEARLADLPAP